MAKESASKHKDESSTSKAANEQASIPSQEQASPLTASSQAKKNGKEGRKADKPRIGGTAVPGAKSTQPKPPPATTNNGQQQAESYNRDMRRRMQHLGTGPYAEQQRTQMLQDQRKKRLDRRKQRLEERREELRKSLPEGKLSLGRKNLYFIIAVIALVVLLIVVFAVLRVTHIL